MRLLAAAALASTVFALPSALEPRAACVDGVHVIAVGGQGTVQGNLGYLSTLVSNITSLIPHSSMQQIGYPVGLNGSAAVLYAIPLFQQAIESYAAQCPRTKIVLASYSLGGATDMDVLCGAAATGAGALTGTYKKNILANVVYGDLTYVPNLPYDTGTCTTAGGLVTRVNPSLCAPYGSITHSYCDENDINCCSGDSLAVHFSYPETYDLIASQWVASMWQQYRSSPEYKPPKKSKTVSHKPSSTVKPTHKPSSTMKPKHKPKSTTKPKSTSSGKAKPKTTTKSHPKPSSKPKPKKSKHTQSGSKGSNGSKHQGSSSSSSSSGSGTTTSSTKISNQLMKYFFNFLKNHPSK